MGRGFVTSDHKPISTCSVASQSPWATTTEETQVSSTSRAPQRWEVKPARSSGNVIAEEDTQAAAGRCLGIWEAGGVAAPCSEDAIRPAAQPRWERGRRR